MTHDEMLTKFTALKLREGSLVKITLNDKSEHVGELSSGKVHVETNEKNEKINSRIGLRTPPHPDGKVIPIEVKPVYTENIKEITKL